MIFPSSSDPVPRWSGAILGVLAAVAIGGPLWVVTHPPRLAVRPPQPHRPVRVVPPAEIPPVEPVAFQDMTPADARAWNAGVPFVAGPNPAARPFRLGGGEEDRARAIDCMAAAMLYEAGDDPIGERAVGQVVINRVRHPAFPRTVCGVVFQGQERSTGCQFTFTCDGAITRAPDPDAWRRAQQLATQALTGRVDPEVGYATHYHTDWVVPYWSASLDKIAEVHTHLFFRWTGWWGTPPAFRRTADDAEPVIARLAAWSPAHAMAAALDEGTAATAQADALLATLSGAATGDTGTFLLTLDRKLTADQLPAFAKVACGTRDYCKLMAWTRKQDTPPALPATPEQLGRMAFSYLRDRAKGFDKPLWNCTVFPRGEPHDCMKTQAAPPRPVVTPSPLPAPRATLSLPAVTPATAQPGPTPRPGASATPRKPPPATP